jgi:hypothetical protein
MQEIDLFGDSSKPTLIPDPAVRPSTYYLNADASPAPSNRGERNRRELVRISELIWFKHSVFSETALAALALKLRDNERRRLARELHDSVGQLLAANPSRRSSALGHSLRNPRSHRMVSYACSPRGSRVGFRSLAGVRSLVFAVSKASGRADWIHRFPDGIILCDHNSYHV